MKIPSWISSIIMIVFICAVVVGGVFVVVAGCGWIAVGIPIGSSWNTVGTIELYEHSSFAGEHTWVVLQTLGGTEASFALVGYHDFVIGTDYEIHTVCARGGLLGLENWYRVVEIIER